jgi:hypothetical protein
MTTASNSKIFTDSIFGLGTDATASELIEKERTTVETYLGSSTYSNFNTRLPKVPSNQKIAKGS